MPDVKVPRSCAKMIGEIWALMPEFARFCGRRFFSQNTLLSSWASNSERAASGPEPWNGDPTDRPVTDSASAGSYVVVTATGLMSVREMVSGAKDWIRAPSWRMTWLLQSVMRTASSSERSHIS